MVEEMAKMDGKRIISKWSRSTLLVITIVVVIFGAISGYVISTTFLSNNNSQSPHNPCDIPNTLVMKYFVNTTNITQNNGGWIVRVNSMSCEPPSWNASLRIATFNGVPIDEYKLSKEKADIITNITLDNRVYQVRIFLNGNGFIVRNHTRLPVNTSNLQVITEEELKTAENVSLIVIIPQEVQMNKIRAGSYFIVFRDNNGDTIDDVFGGSLVIIFEDRQSAAENQLPDFQVPPD